MFGIQLPWLIFEIIQAFINGTFGSDSAQGFFGHNCVSYAAFFPLFFVSHQYFIEGGKKYKTIFWLLLFVLVLPMGEYAIVAYFFILPLFIIINLFKNKRVFFRFITISLLFIIFIGSYALISKRYSSRTNTVINAFNPTIQYIRLTKHQNTVSGGSHRNLYFALTQSNLRRYAFHEAIGFGPGMYASYVAYRFMPPTNYLIYNAFNQMELFGLDPSVDSQIIPIWGEMGYIGITIFILFLIIVSIFFWFRYKKAETSETRGYALTSSVGTIFLLIGFYVNHLWEIHTVFMTLLIFWYISLEQSKDEKIIKLKTT
jgi:hypothetical protein